MQASPVTGFFSSETRAHIAHRPPRFLGLSFVLLLLCSFASVAHGQAVDPIVVDPQATNPVEDYCRLTISLMQRSVEEWQERLPVADKIKTDRKKLASALQAVTKKYQDLRSEEYKQFGFDQKTYLHYATDHKTEIENYLEDNPEVKQAIDDLQKQIDRLIEQFESAASPQPEGAEK
jgi:hypothetical protein